MPTPTQTSLSWESGATVFLRNLSKCFKKLFPPPQSQNLVGQNGDVVASFVQKVVNMGSPESDCGGGESF